MKFEEELAQKLEQQQDEVPGEPEPIEPNPTRLQKQAPKQRKRRTKAEIEEEQAKLEQEVQEIAENLTDGLEIDSTGHFILTVGVVGIYRNTRKGPQHNEFKSFCVAIKEGDSWIPMGKCYMKVPNEVKDRFEDIDSDELTNENLYNIVGKGTVKPSQWIKEPFTVQIRTKGVKESKSYPLHAEDGRRGLNFISPVFLDFSDNQVALTSQVVNGMK